MLQAIEATLATSVVGSARVHGGDTAAAFRLDLADGRRVFAKTHASPPAHFFDTEAVGLRWLREAHAVAVPEVLLADDSHAGGVDVLVLEWIDEGRPGPTTEADLGRGLAALHAAGAPSFGRIDGRTTGSLGLPNDPCDTWVEFFRERRLLPLARIAEERAALPEQLVAGVRTVAERLEQLAGPVEAPARLHGDLWAGNRLVDRNGHSWLIDPACVGGHREFDLAMMRLFGGFGPEVEAAYDEVHPRAAGWEERVELWQLAPLVVHAIKFGGGYVGAVERAVRRYA